MKKLIVSIIFIIATINLMAQLSLGPKIGYTASTLSTDSEDIKKDFNNTLHFGAFVRLGGKTYLQPELLFMTKGAEFGYNLQEGAKQNVELNTIDIPVLIGFKLIDLKIADIRAMGGPVGSFVINKDIKAKGAISEVDELGEDDISDANWGLQAGVGVDVLSLSLDVRYHFSLTNAYNETFLLDQFDTDNVKNNAFLVTLGWKIL